MPAHKKPPRPGSLEIEGRGFRIKEPLHLAEGKGTIEKIENDDIYKALLLEGFKSLPNPKITYDAFERLLDDGIENAIMHIVVEEGLPVHLTVMKAGTNEKLGESHFWAEDRRLKMEFILSGTAEENATSVADFMDSLASSGLIKRKGN